MPLDSAKHTGTKVVNLFCAQSALFQTFLKLFVTESKENLFVANFMLLLFKFFIPIKGLSITDNQKAVSISISFECCHNYSCLC